MDADVEKELREQRALLEKVYKSSEATRKYFKWTLIITVALIVLPLIGLLFAIPAFLQNFSALYGSIK